MSLELWQFKGPKSTVGFLALFSMLWQQSLCSRTDERSETEDVSELWPAKPPFMLDEDNQSPGLFVFASVPWKRVLQPRILRYSPSCTQLWESSIHSFSCCLFSSDKAEVDFFFNRIWILIPQGLLSQWCGSSADHSAQSQAEATALQFVGLDANLKRRALHLSLGF